MVGCEEQRDVPHYDPTTGGSATQSSDATNIVQPSSRFTLATNRHVRPFSMALMLLGLSSWLGCNAGSDVLEEFEVLSDVHPELIAAVSIPVSIDPVQCRSLQR